VSRRFVSDHAGEYPVTRLCALLGVARSSFYVWRGRSVSRRDLDDVVLAGEIVEVHQASQGTYGAPRIHGQLRHRGWRVGRKRVARLMAARDLVGVCGRRKWRRGRPNTAPAPDLLGRGFTAEASDQRWVADITESACWDGKLFLAGIKDLHDQSIAGWSMGTRQTTDLVVNALVMALGRRHPGDELIHHADRGRNTPVGSSRPAWRTGVSHRRSRGPGTASTMPPWNQPGPRSNEKSATSTATGRR